MLRLPILASDNANNIGPPHSGYDFERFCIDAFPLIQAEYAPISGYDKTLSAGYGKNGERQYGVDIFDHLSSATAQCKRREKLSLYDLKLELKELVAYPREISIHFILISLTQTPRSLIDFVIDHNRVVDARIAAGGAYPVRPAVALPKLLILNWGELSRILSQDFFLAAKWGFRPFDSTYQNLGGVDIQEVEGAVSTMNCFLPADSGGKSGEILAAIRSMTRRLDPRRIAKIGLNNTVHTYDIMAMYAFLDELDKAWNMGVRFKRAAPLCNSLDPATKRAGLRELNEVVVYRYWIGSVKYLSILKNKICGLLDLLDCEDFYYHPDGLPIEHPHYDHTEIPVNTYERTYNILGDVDLPLMDRNKILRMSNFIAEELNKVRTNFFSKKAVQ